jgi:hypothetical protein
LAVRPSLAASASKAKDNDVSRVVSVSLSSDAGVLESETETRKASVLPLLQVRSGDVVRCASYILTSPDHFSPGARMEFDYTYLRLFRKSVMLPASFVVRRCPALAFPPSPSYFNRVIRVAGNPIAHLDSRF